jgi:hypothetical protein
VMPRRSFGPRSSFGRGWLVVSFLAVKFLYAEGLAVYPTAGQSFRGG